MQPFKPAFARCSALAFALIQLPLLSAAPEAIAQDGGARMVTRPLDVREEIVGYDAARSVLAYVERTPMSGGGFAHVALVELSRDGTVHRIRLTTDEDLNQWRIAQNSAGRDAIRARIERDINAARSRFAAGSVLPVALQGSVGSCTRAPFATRQFSVGDGMVAQVTVGPSGDSSTVSIQASGRNGESVSVPSVTMTEGSTTVHAPYDRVADVRELPGVRQFAVLMRSDACTPEGTAVPVHALFLTPPPPPEQPLPQLTHAELQEATVVRALAPHARRRTVDEVSSFYDGSTRVVFDTAWTLPSESGDRVLVQFTRIERDMPPTVVDLGQVPTHFAVMSRGPGDRLRVLSEIAPPTSENVFEGTGAEAYRVELDGVGRPEIVVRAHYRPEGETVTLLRWGADDSLQFVWRGTAVLDERSINSATPNDVRRCDVGVDGQTLVLRCAITRYAAGAPHDAAPIGAERVVQRVRWNGGALQITEERH